MFFFLKENSRKRNNNPKNSNSLPLRAEKDQEKCGISMLRNFEKKTFSVFLSLEIFEISFSVFDTVRSTSGSSDDYHLIFQKNNWYRTILQKIGQLVFQTIIYATNKPNYWENNAKYQT